MNTGRVGNVDAEAVERAGVRPKADKQMHNREHEEEEWQGEMYMYDETTRLHKSQINCANGQKRHAGAAQKVTCR